MSRTKWVVAGVWMVLAILVLSPIAGLTTIASATPGSSSGSLGSSSPPPQAPATPHSGNSNLVVNGGTVVLTPQGNGGLSLYPMSGNITVENGGTLEVYNMTIQFLSFTRDICTCASALLSRFDFNILSGGHVYLYNSTITTNVLGLNPYIKLNLSMTGGSTLSLTHDSRLAFPGSLFVTDNSSVFLNDSTVTNNPYINNPSYNYDLPSNVTSDSGYAPSLKFSAESELVSIGSDINGTYASPLSGGPALNMTVQSSSLNVPLGLGVVNDSFGILATPLAYDTYDAWSGASVNFDYTNIATTATTATFDFSAYGMTGEGPLNVTFQPGSGHASVPIPSWYVTNVMNQDDLAALLGQITSSTISVAVSGASQAGVALNATWLEIAPLFDYNILFVKSTFIGLDSSIDVNWMNPALSGPAGSNKFELVDDSQAFLVNSTSNSFPTNLYTNSSAFEPDDTSNFYVLQFVDARIVTNVGSPVEGAQLTANASITGAPNPNQGTANHFTQLSWLHQFEPTLYGALDSWAINTEGAPLYSFSNAQGVASIAVITNNLTAYSLPDGVGFGEYNMTVQESADNVTNGVQEFKSARASSPSLCSWPYQPNLCGRPVWLTPTPVAPLLTADVRITSAVLDEQDAAARSTPVEYFENSSVQINVTLRDWNYFPVQGGALPVYLFDQYYGGPSSPYNISVAQTMVTTSDFANSAVSTTISLVFTLPYSTAGLHTLEVLVDPYHTTSWPSYDAKVAEIDITSEGSPFWSQPLSGSPSVGLVTTLMSDATTLLPVTGTTENTGNTVLLTADVTNDGDIAATPGSTTVQFRLGTLNAQGIEGWTWVGQTQTNGNSIGATSSETFTADVQVLCSCSTTVQVYVNYSLPNPGVNAPAPFSFRANFPYVASTIDYTSLVLTNENTSALQGNGTYLNIGSTAGTHVGGVLDFSFNINNGGGVGTNGSVSLWILVNAPTRTLLQNVVTQNPFGASADIQPATLYKPSLFWEVSASVIGQDTGVREFVLMVTYNNGPRLQRSSDIFENVTILPSLVSFSGVSELPDVTQESPTDTASRWTLVGLVKFDTNPAAPAMVGLNIFFINSQDTSENESFAPTISASNITQEANATTWGSTPSSIFKFGLPQLPPLSAGVYNLVIVATLGGTDNQGGAAESTYFHMTMTVGIVVPSGCSGFFSTCNLTFIIIIIAVVAVAVVVALFLLMGRTGKGRLVECGECGELIPDKAPACPKCGAEFEAEMVRCSRCASTIPAASTICPECSALLLGKQGAQGPEEQTRKDYAQSIDRYRAEGRKELGETYSEGAFWDWWKRQPSYLSYSAFKLQQAQGGRTGMAAPAAQGMSQGGADAYGPGGPQGPPGPGGPAMGTGPMPGQAPPQRRGRGPPPGQPGMPPSQGGMPPDMSGMGAMPAAAAGGPGGPGGPSVPSGGMKSCSSCGREINSDFLVCPFCGAATR